MQLSVSSLRNAVMAIGFLTLVTGCLNERQYDPPTVSVSVSPTKAAIDTPVTVTWSSQYAQSCTASGDWSGSKDASGSQTITVKFGGASPTVNTFTLSCTGRGGNTSASATLEIVPPPNISISFPSDALPGEAVKLTWSTSNATSCSASGNWSGTKATSGTEEPLAPLNSTAETLTYALTCTGPGGSRTNSVSVKYLGFIASKVAGSRLYVTSEALPGYPPGYAAGGGAILDFTGTSTGVLLNVDSATFNGRYGIAGKQTFSWAVENGKLTISYTSPRSSTGFPNLEDIRLDPDERTKLLDSGYSQVPVTATSTGVTYAKARGSLSNYAGVAPSTSTSNSRLTVEPIRLRDGSLLTLRNYPLSNSTPDGKVILRAPSELTSTKFVAACPSISGSNTFCLGGVTFAGINYTDTGTDATTGQLGPDSFVADVMRFNADGTGVFGSDNSTFTWTVNADGSATIRGQEGSAVLRLADFAIADNVATGGLFSGVFGELTLNNGTSGAIYFGLVPLAIESSGSRFTFDSTYPVNASGKFWRAEINNWNPSRRDASGAIRAFDIFGWKFATGGSGSLIAGETADCNNDGTASEIRGVVSPLSNWSISTGTGLDAGILVSKRNGAGTVRERSWFPVARGTASNGDRFFYAIEFEDILGNVGSTPFPEGRTFIAPRLSKWVEVADAWTCTR
ncbi:MAG: hypothetical protein FGM43_11240 [Sinobacteraceae bacterium]|nr:hypothetical protein [Nevskiaceae bacterium]